MRSVGLKVLKNKLSEYVRLAAAGETILVMDRERVVAEIGPPRLGRDLPDDELMARGVLEGWLTPPRIEGAGPSLKGKPAMSLEQLVEEIGRDRGDR
jgi:antitoxin (DNA-binding transcriptional repressor) of toxin-antitoxin stability system